MNEEQKNKFIASKAFMAFLHLDELNLLTDKEYNDIQKRIHDRYGKYVVK